MAEITRQVGVSSDDCLRRLTPTFWSLTAVDITVGSFSSTLYQYGGGMRFTNITIPQGATITGAYLTLMAAFTQNAVNVKSRISAEDVDDAITFADDRAAFDTRWGLRTTARVDWDDIESWTAGSSYDSPSIVSVIQEIVDRGGWVGGQDMVIFWDDFEDRTAHFDKQRRCAQEEHATYDAPKLVITYIVPRPVADGDLIGIGIIKKT